jgi:hypothetical protein
LGSKGQQQQQQRSSGSLKSPSQQKLPQKQLTADVPWIMLDEESPEKVEGRSSSWSATVKDSMRMTAEDFDFIGTKSGMSALWKFLWGTMGERNWLFWVDAERVKYYTKPVNRQRYTSPIQLHYSYVKYWIFFITLDYFVRFMTGTFIPVVH